MEPIPNTPILNQSSAKNSEHESLWSAFQNILTFISLFFFAASLYLLWIMFIDYWYPITNYGIFTLTHPINYPLSILLTSLPLFIILFTITNNRYYHHPELKKELSKKMLNYTTLVITFIILLVSTASTVNTILNNSLSIRSGLNLMVIFLITGPIFLYYLYEARFEKNPGSIWKYISISVIVVLISVVTTITAFSIRNNSIDKVKRGFEANREIRVNQRTKKVIAAARNTPLTGETVQGIDFSISKVEVYEFSGEKILEVELIFSANEPCPLTGGAECGVNNLGIKVKDEMGGELISTNLNDPDILQGSILKQGEQIKGKKFFKVNNKINKFTLTYNDSSGNYSSPVELLMEKD